MNKPNVFLDQPGTRAVFKDWTITLVKELVDFVIDNDLVEQYTDVKMTSRAKLIETDLYQLKADIMRILGEHYVNKKRN